MFLSYKREQQGVISDSNNEASIVLSFLIVYSGVHFL